MNLEHFWTVRHIRNNEVIYEEEYVPNTIANQGIASMLEYFYRGNISFAPGQFYVRLCNFTPSITSTLTSLSPYEPSTNGYAPQLVTATNTSAGFPTSTSDVNGSTITITSKVVTFTADGGNIGPVTTAYVATSSDNSGRLISYLPLALTRTILNGDSMTYSWQTQEN